MIILTELSSSYNLAASHQHAFAHGGRSVEPSSTATQKCNREYGQFHSPQQLKHHPVENKDLQRRLVLLDTLLESRENP